MNKTISKILDRCLKRDMRAQMELYDMYSRKVFNSCYRILDNREEAEEVTQDSFLKIFKMLERFENCPESIEYFLKKMATNQAIDIVRKRRVLFTELNDGIDMVDTEMELENENQSVSDIKECISKLHSSQRLIITLKLIENLENKEIAEKLNISESTVRTQFMRAKNKLIEQLNNRQNER